MKLIILITIVGLAYGEYPAAQPEPPSDSYGAPASDSVESSDENPSPSSSSSPIDLTKTFFNFQKGFTGAFPPSTIPHANFLTKTSFPAFKYPFRTFNYPTTFSTNPQGIVPPQLTQIIPPISNIVPPIFGTNQPALPVNPSQIVPPQVVPPQVVSQPVVQPQVPTQAFPPQLVTPQTFARPTPLFTPQFPKFTYNYAFPNFNTYFKAPYTFPTFPTTGLFSAPLPAQKEPAKNQEPLSTSYGQPATEAPAPFEPSGPVETSAPFEPAPVSFPYEPAVPDTPEPAPAPYKPAQEYGVPN